MVGRVVRRSVTGALTASVLFAVTAVASASAASYRLAATFHVPVPADAARGGWCYDTASVDPVTHRYYLADASNRQITVIDPVHHRTGAIGRGSFTGVGGCADFSFDRMGPDGTAVVGGRIFAGNGNSHVLVFSLKGGRRLADVDTRGRSRADELTRTARDLIVTNPDDKPAPYITFVNLRSYKIDGTFRFTRATAGIEQPRVWRGHLYVSVPQTVASPKGGEVDELDISNPRHARIVRRFAFASCQPAGLAINRHGIAAVGCGGPAQEILNLNNGHQAAVTGAGGGDVVDATASRFFFVSTAVPALVIADGSGKTLQRFPATPASHTVTVDPGNGDLWVPQDGGVVDLYTRTPR
jgi:hypothetical protein